MPIFKSEIGQQFDPQNIREAFKKNSKPAVSTHINLEVLKSVDLSGIDLSESVIRKTNFNSAKFDRSVLNQIYFNSCDLMGASFENAVITHARFTNCNFFHANFKNAVLDACIFDKCDLRGANFEGARIHATTFWWSDLKGIRLKDTSLRNIIGDMKQIKSMTWDNYSVVYTHNMLQIDSERHSIEDWWKFDDSEIIRMLGFDGLAWWKKWKDLIRQTIELSPAEPV